jgi:hypothetical protein
MFEALPEAVVPPLLRRGAASADLRARLYRHWRPTRLKSTFARVTLRRFARKRLGHRDQACHHDTCDCVWCKHDPDHTPAMEGCSSR